MPTKLFNISPHIPVAIPNIDRTPINQIKIGELFRVLSGSYQGNVFVKIYGGHLVCLWAPKKNRWEMPPFSTVKFYSSDIKIGKLSHRERIIVTSNYPEEGIIPAHYLKSGQLARLTSEWGFYSGAIVVRIRFYGWLVAIDHCSTPFEITWSQNDRLNVETLSKKVQIEIKQLDQGSVVKI